jgi:F-type H+-transporting ATPase subunit alpha
VEILKQAQYSPMPVGEQVAILYCGVKGLLLSLPIEKVQEFEKQFLRLMREDYADVLARIAGGEMNDEIGGVISNAAARVKKQL